MAPETWPSRLATSAATVPGAALTMTFAAVSRLRPAAKPLHPSGRMRSVTVHRTGLVPGVGVPFVDSTGSVDAVARLSRATGLPAPLPDIHGLALRIPLDDGSHADLLLATTGLGRVGRFVLTASRHPLRRAYSTLLPYRSPTGPLLLAARPVGQDERVLTLSVASPGGPWRPFGYVELSRPGADGPTGDEHLAFDPVTNPLPGLEHYPWAARLREGSYRTARRSRGDRRAAP
jgi:hypothetical protein